MMLFTDDQIHIMLNDSGFFQYDRAMAGSYPGRARRLRRVAEAVAHRRGVTQPPRLHAHAQSGAAPTGAPGLLGGAPSAAEYDERRRAAYGPGRLP